MLTYKVLAHYNPKLSLKIATDVSSYGAEAGIDEGE